MPAITTFISSLIPALMGNWKKLAVFFVLGVLAGWKAGDLWQNTKEVQRLHAENTAWQKALAEREEGEDKRFIRGMALEKALGELRKESNFFESAREYAKPEYTDCALPADGLRHLQKAARAVNATRMR